LKILNNINEGEHEFKVKVEKDNDAKQKERKSKIKFNKLLEEKNDWDTTSFPHTFNHTEDVIFLTPTEEWVNDVYVTVDYAVSLECIFY
jgi:hypothetical protein